MNDETLVQLIVLAPFASTVLLYSLRKILPPAMAGMVACAAVLTSFVAAVVLFGNTDATSAFTVHLADWMTGKNFAVNFAFRVDPLSLTWTLFITGIGFLIHVYSLGYMKGDPGFTRFFTYLNMFIGSMLALVLGDSLVLMFLGWEGVGLCSYLLIGFWFEEMDNAKAGQKAFVVNRIGDLGFLLGMLTAFFHFGTLNIADLLARITTQHADGALAVGDPAVTWMALFFFIGAIGKSAQLPLYVWLPDAMAGPTPVSALIHAATMVTAGIYLVARLSPIFALSPTASTTVAVIGAATALFSASIALRQRDIKKVLAYSTCSQLGYMFLALGIGAYTAAVFHVITHAFFKALLFLGAGSVIHAMSNEQDAMKMGGLKPHLKKTHVTFFIGCFALSGIAPFAGFFSKDKILGEAILGGGLISWLGVIGLITAYMTAFYTWRLYHLIFSGKERLDEHAKSHLHESPATMTLPLMVLAVLSTVGGFLSLPHFTHSDKLGHYLEPIFAPAYTIRGALMEHSVGIEVGLLMVSLVIALLGYLLAKLRYADGPGDEVEPGRDILSMLLENKWFVDELYAIFIVGPMRAISHLTAFFDKYVIDGLVNGIAKGADSLGAFIRALQNGAIHTYGFLLLAGAVYLAITLL